MPIDKITDWYGKIEKMGGEDIKIKLDKNFSKHLIKPSSTIALIGGTGSGKTTWLIEFLSRKKNVFHEIIIFTGSTLDEPLYNLLDEMYEGVNFIEDVEDLPNLEEYEDNKKVEKIIVFDDILNLETKDINKIAKFYNSCRKYGFTAVLMAQSYEPLPPKIRRNIMVFVIGKLNDVNEIKAIIRTHCTGDKEKQKIIFDVYNNIMKDVKDNDKQYFTIDFRNNDPKHKFRHNFTTLLNIPS